MRIPPWFCLNLLLHVVHGTGNMCAHMLDVSVKFARKLRDFREYAHSNVAANTRNMSSASSGFWGAPWHPSMSKKGLFFSQTPGFYFLENLKVLLPTQPYEGSFSRPKP